MCIMCVCVCLGIYNVCVYLGVTECVWVYIMCLCYWVCMGVYNVCLCVSGYI